MGPLFSGIVAISGRDGITVSLPGHSHWDGMTVSGRPRRGESVRAAVERLTRDLIAEQRVVGRRHARRVAQCYSTPPNQVTPGPEGTGLGPWADGPLDVVVGWPWHDRGVYAVTLWAADDDTDGE